MPLPELDAESRREALERAAEARKIRAELKQQLKSGEIDFGDVLERAATDEIVAKTKVLTVLAAMPKLGNKRARRIMEDLNIAESRRVRGLGPHQRERLMRHFEQDDAAVPDRGA
ncbi:MAG TPA: integration host factor, actinobacterial type [Egibacteraceae bacterium]|nr:integration host factor, actinobacterial type [Egibacteraceae bacterium]